MKKILLTFAATASVFSALAIDGSFSATSALSTGRVYTYDVDGTTKLAKAQGAVEFLYNGAVVGNASYGFAGPGTFSAGVLNIPGQAGNTVNITVEIWDITTAATYEQAKISGNYLPAQTFAVQLGSDKLPPGELSGFTGGKLVPAPEPSTIALAALGLGGLLFISRRK